MKIILIPLGAAVAAGILVFINYRERANHRQHAIWFRVLGAALLFCGVSVLINAVIARGLLGAITYEALADIIGGWAILGFANLFDHVRERKHGAPYDSQPDPSRKAPHE